MQFFKKSLVLVTVLTSVLLGAGCSTSDFRAPRYGVPITAGGGVGYSSTVIQTVLVVNESHEDVLIEFPQFGPLRVEALSTARKNIRVTERMEIAYSVTYFRPDGRKLKVDTGCLCLEPIFDPYSGGRGGRSPTPKIVVQKLYGDYLRELVQ
jgi:hypothetical protein